MKKLIEISMLLMFLFICLTIGLSQEPIKEEVTTQEEYLNAGFTKFIKDIEPKDVSYEEEARLRTESKLELYNLETVEQIKELKMSDIDLLATLVRCEAGNQPAEGKRAVVDVVLNRVDSEEFPNTIREVIYEPHQFDAVNPEHWNKYSKEVDRTDYDAVEQELKNRSDYEIIYFSSGGNANGEFVYVIGDHYFARR